MKKHKEKSLKDTSVKKGKGDMKTYWLRGAEPRESGPQETTWTVTLTFRDVVESEEHGEKIADDQYNAICNALSAIRKSDGLVDCEVDDDPERTWL